MLPASEQEGHFKVNERVFFIDRKATQYGVPGLKEENKQFTRKSVNAE